jgi:hypothetical protein
MIGTTATPLSAHVALSCARIMLGDVLHGLLPPFRWEVALIDGDMDQ